MDHADRCFVFTGAHGVGKSSLIRAMEYQGERVVREAAQDVRLLMEAAGDPFPLDRDDFESRCLQLHRMREERARASGGTVFLDRGCLDYLAYAELGPWPLSDAERDHCRATRYDAVFLVLPHGREWGSTLRAGEREFCERLVCELRRLYTELGMPVYEVPAGDVWERAGWVRARCAETGQAPLRRSATSPQKAVM
ncbi:ATP/GTP-binding protein [Nonomuraea turcica]|uniref:ATP/GTP-binding protein n=1 Tax=Nonomuraea sp. G32 TaxID=3067274 RepID=UPI00273AA55F|nr:ATP-binding protein [Nonomuraea sp. G32]MDP4500512.1 ATP-binding protein [Nonomuraea sp. G32]